MISELVARHHGYLGTVIELRVGAAADDAAVAMETAAIAEIARLETVFNVFNPGSRINRWKRAEVSAGAEIETVRRQAERWGERSGGAFDPYVGLFRETWADAAARNKLPTDAELATARRQDLAALDLNGIAKGWIVDRAVEAAMEQPGAARVTVNGGGDIRHTGPNLLRVGIENPERPYDNVPPLAKVGIDHGAIATSGGARRGWEIEGRWYSHVLDPRNGKPVDHVAQVSVLAATACSADVVATALTVLSDGERDEFLAAIDEPIGYFLIRSDGHQVSNGIWDAHRFS